MKDEKPEQKMLDRAKRLQAIAQNGLTYAQDPYDVERFEQVQAIAAEILADRSPQTVAEIVDLFSDQVGYATPKVDVRGVVFLDGRILLVRELADGNWTLPGGWADPCESPREAVAREVFEESGFEVVPTKLLAVYDRSKHPHEPPFAFHVYKIFIQCEVVGGQASGSIETEGAAFFAEDNLPPLSISRVTTDQIRRLFEFYRNSDLPTDFD